jgi:aconitate hydratase
MRAKAGDPPRTMAQKILAGRSPDPSLAGEMVEVKVDQIVLARAPMRAFGEALHAGLKKTSAEVAIVYDGCCVTGADAVAHAARGGASRVSSEVLAHGLVIARPGVGYPSMVHLERFASPARLCVTDEPRLAGVGGIGMLSIVMSPALLGDALAKGTVWMRPPRSVQILLSGRARPFVCARDIALELMRRGLGEAVRRVEAEYAAPVVLEFAGPSARLLSVSERAVLSSLAPQLGAVAALFISDERTEVFLRDQRRSKAHRALAPDAGAPCDEVLNVDLGAVDPLLLDEHGVVRAVRDLAGKPVTQVLLGGDSGVTLRDFFAAAALLKSKRVPPRLDLLLAIPTRQMLEVLASTGQLTDLIATGARIIEPDARVVSGELYPPPSIHGSRDGLALRTCDPEPYTFGVPQAVVASAETLAYAIATGEIGDPRAFKRPVRVTLPRVLPTDDVLVRRERKSVDSGAKKAPPAVLAALVAWKTAQTLDLVDAKTWASRPNDGAAPARGVAVVCSTLDEVRDFASRASSPRTGGVRAIVAPFLPSALVTLFSAAGIAALQAETSALIAPAGPPTKPAKAMSVDLPAPSAWTKKDALVIAVGPSKVKFAWLASVREREWVTRGARPRDIR